MKKIIFILFCSISLWSCIVCKEPNPDTEMYFTETQCANPWKDETVEKWLTGKKIKYSDLHFETYQMDFVCQACNCPSGRYIRLKANSENVSELETLGFKKK